MKTNLPARIGIVEALGIGLNEAAKRPLLWVFPAVIDLILWLAPRFSVEQLGQRLVDTYKGLLPLVYTPQQIAGMQDMIKVAQESTSSLGKQVNVLGVLALGWLNPPSAVAGWQPTRFLLFSDSVLAPLGMTLGLRQVAPAPTQGAPVQVGSVWALLALLVGLWLVGQFLVTLFYRSAALGLNSSGTRQSKPSGMLPRLNEGEVPPRAVWEPVHPPSLGRLMLRISVLSAIAASSTVVLMLPLAFVGLFSQVAGSRGSELLMALSGGVTLWLLLWFLSALYFVGDLLVLEGAPLWPSLFQSLVLVRMNGFRTLIFAAVINVIMLGARAVWGMIGVEPLGALIAILVSSVLGTGMLLSVFVYYRGLRRYWLAARAIGQTGGR